MNRRDLLKSTAVMMTASLITPVVKGFPGYEGIQVISEKKQIPRFGDGRDWFFERRYGMFVHWGIYSIPGWYEQHQWRGRIERSEYIKLAGQWNPKKFNPEQWLDIMEEAGMEYITITTKHHDGFCL